MLDHASDREATIGKPQATEERPLQVLLVAGSARRVDGCPGLDSKARYLMHRMTARLPPGWQIDTEDIGNEHGKPKIQGCNGCVSSSMALCVWPCNCYGPNSDTQPDLLWDRDLYGRQTVLFLDEIHRFTKAQQDALLPGVENGWVILIAATTENPSFSVISPLLSRSLLLTLEQLSDDDLRLLVDRAIEDPRGLGGRVDVDDEAKDAIVRLASGDARRALTALEAAASSAAAVAEEGERAVVTAEIVSSAVDRALLRYDKNGDEHYDVISAFIKSIRGSDVDAALHYLARMIEAGEDPRFIGRRLIISAAEDVGMADPQALPIAVAAADAVQLIGMPEGRIPLAEATVYLATAAKSNAAYNGINAAIADVRAGAFGRVPKHLRDAHYAGAKKLGHGTGYRYPHDAELGVVQQQYLPDELARARYYQPTNHGNERDVASRLEKLRRIIRGITG